MPTTKTRTRPKPDPAPPSYQLPAGRALMLRTSNADRRSYNDFQWPEAGEVTCPDWKPTRECGNGLHGALFGEGDGGLFNWSEDATWQVVEVDAATVIDLGGKVKVPGGIVVYSGDRPGAQAFLEPHAAGKCVIGAVRSAGTRGTATAGDGGTATAGTRGTATAGTRGTATAGDRGTATAGYGGTATAGTRGTATAGDGGTATAGTRGTATAGYGGTATAGTRGTATAGDGGTATAGENGALLIQWYDPQRSAYRWTAGFVGEDGVRAGIAYRLDAQHKLVEAPAAQAVQA